MLQFDLLKRDLQPFDVTVRSTSKEISVNLTEPPTKENIGSFRLILEPEKKLVAVESMYVDSDYQNLGIGKICTRHIVELAKATGYDKVALWAENQGSLFWPKVGFLPEQNTQRGTNMLGVTDNSQTYLGWDRARELVSLQLDWLAEDKIYPTETIDRVKQDICQSDPKSLWVLFTQKEYPSLAADALKGVKMNMALSFDNPDQVERWQSQTQGVSLNVDKISSFQSLRRLSNTHSTGVDDAIDRVIAHEGEPSVQGERYTLSKSGDTRSISRNSDGVTVYGDGKLTAAATAADIDYTVTLHRKVDQALNNNAAHAAPTQSAPSISRR